MKHFTDSLFEEFSYLLVEDLDTMLKYAPNLQTWEREDILVFLRKDPTWNEAKEQGLYSKWIIDKLNRNLLSDSHLDRLGDVLKAFHDNKAQLKNKDINQFKTIQELDDYLNNDDSYIDLSHRQQVRQRQKERKNVDLAADADKIYEDTNWEVWVPNTYAASCRLGQGTKWCTATTETDREYKDYSSKGKLYININKKNPKKKYQFHFETDSYMDKNDHPITLFDFFTANKANRALYDNVYKNKVKFDLDVIAGLIKTIEENNNTFIYDGTISRENLEFVKDYIEHLTIKEGVTQLDQKLFYFCDSLKSVIIPDSITTIGENAFANCKNLTTITLGKNVTDIEEGAFHNCGLLTSITLPSSIKRINDYAFAGCYRLTTVTLSENLEKIGNGAFHSCRALTKIAIPKSVTNIDEFAFMWCTSLTIYCEETRKPSGWADKWNWLRLDSAEPVDTKWGYKNKNKD